MRGECREALRIFDAIAPQALQDDQQSFLDEVLQEAVIAAGASAQEHTQTGLELPNQLGFGGAISLANSARQLSAWNEIHTLRCP